MQSEVLGSSFWLFNILWQLRANSLSGPRGTYTNECLHQNRVQAESVGPNGGQPTACTRKPAKALRGKPTDKVSEPLVAKKESFLLFLALLR